MWDGEEGAGGTLTMGAGEAVGGVGLAVWGTGVGGDSYLYARTLRYTSSQVVGWGGGNGGDAVGDPFCQAVGEGVA